MLFTVLLQEAEKENVKVLKFFKEGCIEERYNLYCFSEKDAFIHMIQNIVQKLSLYIEILSF